MDNTILTISSSVSFSSASFPRKSATFSGLWHTSCIGFPAASIPATAITRSVGFQITGSQLAGTFSGHFFAPSASIRITSARAVISFIFSSDKALILHFSLSRAAAIVYPCSSRLCFILIISPSSANGRSGSYAICVVVVISTFLPTAISSSIIRKIRLVFPPPPTTESTGYLSVSISSAFRMESVRLTAVLLLTVKSQLHFRQCSALYLKSCHNFSSVLYVDQYPRSSFLPAPQIHPG